MLRVHSQPIVDGLDDDLVGLVLGDVEPELEKSALLSVLHERRLDVVGPVLVAAASVLLA